MTTAAPARPERLVEELDRVTIRFAGDSGDGMQLTGTQFTKTAAVYGNDLATLPDYPAEIRAPTGSLPGVSGFQLSFASTEIYTPGDQPDVLVAMNPAALKTNIGDLRSGGLLIVDEAEFNPVNLKKAAYAENPLEDGSLSGYQVVQVNITKNNELALEGSPLTAKDKYGDYGLTGVLIAQRGADAGRIDTLLLSCRVLARRLEIALVREALTELAARWKLPACPPRN